MKTITNLSVIQSTAKNLITPTMCAQILRRFAPMNNKAWAAMLLIATACLTACHPDAHDIDMDNNNRLVPIAPTAQLAGTTTVAASTPRAAITNTLTDGEIALTMHASDLLDGTQLNGKAQTATYTIGNGGTLTTKDGKNIYIAREGAYTFTMPTTTVAAQYAATADVAQPFAVKVKTYGLATHVAADGTFNLDLKITTAGIRLKMKVNNTTMVTSATCLITGEKATTDEHTDGPACIITTATNGSTVKQQEVVFGTLPASTTLQADSYMATLSVQTGSGIKNLPVKLPSSLTPEAGKLYTYTVLVDQNKAVIEGEVTISDFTKGNGDGQDLVVGEGVATADGTTALDPDVFNAYHRVWEVTGGTLPFSKTFAAIVTIS